MRFDVIEARQKKEVDNKATHAVHGLQKELKSLRRTVSMEIPETPKDTKDSCLESMSKQLNGHHQKVLVSLADKEATSKRRRSSRFLDTIHAVATPPITPPISPHHDVMA
eukprot:c26496_g1_i1.p1 GENE.c26496_g1_i1~~c26496_g1_i1.p1  ORF type:complete len:110 (+),score=34.18 c26496_g1_i1:222-551(+)